MYPPRAIFRLFTAEAVNLMLLLLFVIFFVVVVAAESCVYQ